MNIDVLMSSLREMITAEINANKTTSEELKEHYLLLYTENYNILRQQFEDLIYEAKKYKPPVKLR
jgi:hypothetical protein